MCAVLNRRATDDDRWDLAGRSVQDSGCSSSQCGPWRRGRRSGRAAMCATSRADRLLRGRPRPDSRGRQARTVVAQLAALGLCHRHGSRAACRARAGLAGADTSLARWRRSPWSCPTSHERREVAFFDVGQAVLSMMIAAADLGIGSGHGGSRRPRAGAQRARPPGGPRPRTSSHLATRPSARSFRCDSPIGGRSTRRPPRPVVARRARHALSRRPPRRSASRPSSSAAPAPREPLSSRPAASLPGQ